MAALMYVDVPRYSAILFRRTYADLALPGALMDRAREWLSGTAAKWNDTNKTWTFPSGATLTFGYLENASDRFRYQGAEFQFVAFDEIVQHQEANYEYLFSRLRRLQGSDVPIRMRSASNPGGIGHDWVKARFVRGGAASGRPYIPSRIEDNPHLDQVQYLQSLERLDHVTRRQLRDGDWDISAAGNLFLRDWWRYFNGSNYDVTGFVFLTADTAMKDKDTNDPSSLAVWNATPEYLDRIDADHGRWRFPDLLRRVKALWQRYVPYGAQQLYIEDKASGTPLGQVLAEQGIPVVLWKPSDYNFPEDKLGRARMTSWFVESGRIRLPDDDPKMTEAFIDEAARFGGDDAIHDDRVDDLTMACSVWRWKGGAQSLRVSNKPEAAA